MKNNFLKNILRKKKPYIIAEIGINHNGNLRLAKKMILSAKKNNADCVKFQKFIADDYISSKAHKANYQKKDSSVKKKSQLEILRSVQLDEKQIFDLKKFCKKIKVDFLCTPFEIKSLKSLVDIKIKALKISSCNLTNIPFLKEAAMTKLPILLSTGMGNLEEVKNAMKIFKKSKNPILLMQCTSNYPADLKNANLRVLNSYKKLFKCPVGYSDHTSTNVSAIAAVTLGAVVIEKHFTLSRKLPGIDQKASIEPSELKDLVKQTNDAYKALGNPIKRVSSEEKNTFKSLRRSLVAKKDLKKGQKINYEMISIKRPGNGLPTRYIQKILGKKLKIKKRKDELFRLKDFFK